MNIAWHFGLLVAFIACSHGQMSENCNDLYFGGTYTCLQRRLYHGAGSNYRDQFKEKVKQCFKIYSCPAPTFAGAVIASSTKNKLNLTFHALAEQMECFNGSLHNELTKQVGLCYKAGYAKDLGQIPNYDTKHLKRQQHLLDAFDIAQALKTCPTLATAVRACIAADVAGAPFSALNTRVCGNSAICYNLLKARDSSTVPNSGQTCYNEYKVWKAEVCSCYNGQVKATRPTRIAQEADRPTLVDVEDALTGLARLLSGKGVGGSQPLLGKVTASAAEKKKVAHLDKYAQKYSLTLGETVDALKTCKDKQGKVYKPEEFRPSYEDVMLTACGCDPEANEVIKMKCLSSPECLGSHNFDLFKDAVTNFLPEQGDHMAYFCNCGDTF